MSASSSCPTPPPRNADATIPSSYWARDDPPQSPDRPSVAVVAQQRLMKTGAFGSPARRSARLSCLPPPPPPTSQDVQDLDASNGDVAIHLSGSETPENDDLLPDEPSSVLASKIVRAHDNPSPPPQNLAHPGVNYLPGKDGQFPPPVSVPPSPFRPINLLERLTLFPGPLFESPSISRTPSLDVQSDMSESDTILPCDFVSLESSSPSIAHVPVKSTSDEGLASAHMAPSSSTQCTVQDLPSRSFQHLMATTSSLEAEVLISPPAQTIDPSINPTVPSVSLLGSLPRVEPRQSASKPSPHPRSAGLLRSLLSNEGDKTSPDTEAVVPGRQDNDREELISLGGGDSPSLEGEQESKCGRANAKEVKTSSLQSPASPHSAGVLALDLGSSPSIDQTAFPVAPTPIKRGTATPPQTPMRSVAHPDISRTSVQRPVIIPTPMRANGIRNLNSPYKLSLEANDVYRTPAQRVPIGRTFARGTSSLQRTAQLATGAEQSRAERFPTIRAPALTRPALDDPSRSPAKRIPIMDPTASPTRGHQVQSSPARPDLRSRSASVEPRPLGCMLARSRSVEPCATVLKADHHGKVKESIFPVVPMLPRFGTKLPFPLVPGQKSSGDLPPPILEEHENVEIGSPETNATHRVTPSNTTSELRQPSTSSRIPRIGNKPYARPPKNGKATVSTTTANTARAPRAPPFQLACKNSGAVNSNAGVSSTQLTNDQHLVGSLKRKRGAEATTPSNSHPIRIRQVVPGILSDKYAPKPAKLPPQVQAPSESDPPKVPQPMKFRKVVDGMLSARYAGAKANPSQTVPTDSTPHPPSPLSDLSSLSDEGSSDEKPPSTTQPPPCPNGETVDIPRTNVDSAAVEPSTRDPSLFHQDTDDKQSSRPRRTSRTRKPAQQQYVLDVFDSNASTRPPPARRKPQPRTEGDLFMGMSATALKALTTSNTTKNQQTVAVLATEVIRKEGVRPESPMVKARTVLQKQRDERDMRRRERAQKRGQIDEDSGDREPERQSELDDRGSFGAHAEHDENDGVMSSVMPRKHCQGPGDEEDCETPERPERVIEPLKLEGLDGKVKPMKQVKWHRGLSTVVYLDEVDPKPKTLPMNTVVRGCLAPASKNLPLDPLGNLVDLDNRPSPEVASEHVVVKRYLYDNDIEPEPIPPKTTRSKSKKSRS